MSNDRAIAQMTTFCEASNSSPMERRCVTHSFFNRLAMGLPKRYGSTIAEVCLMRMQYSEWNADQGDNANLRRAARARDDDTIMMDCGAAYDEVLAGATDPTNGATHYHDHSIDPPSWTMGATVALTTADFTFYSGVK